MNSGKSNGISIYLACFWVSKNIFCVWVSKNPKIPQLNAQSRETILERDRERNTLVSLFGFGASRNEGGEAFYSHSSTFFVCHVSIAWPYVTRMTLAWPCATRMILA